jgi:Lon protease-like protein
VTATEIPIFPLRSVLCPGVALPLHIFEERYRLLVARCLELDQPFGVVLVREGRDVGPLTGRIAAVGTTAVIRRAGRYPDGRMDILTVGQQRFHLDEVDSGSEPYLVGRVSVLDEPVGGLGLAQEQADRVGKRFLEYLDLLQPDGDADGPEIEIEFEIEVEEGDIEPTDVGSSVEASSEIEPLARDDGSLPIDSADPLLDEMDAADLSADQRRELLMAAANRLTGTDDPTALSYVLTALIQVDLSARQGLLEAPDTVQRLTRLDGILARETFFLKQGLRPIIIDPGQASQRGG